MEVISWLAEELLASQEVIWNLFIFKAAGHQQRTENSVFPEFILEISLLLSFLH